MENEAHDFSVRPANQNNSVRVWEIRNHPLARVNSNNQGEVALADHKLWFAKKYFSGADNYCYILEGKAGEIVGYCRFDGQPSQRAYVVSIAVDPNWQGRGLGHQLLRESLLRLPKGKNIIANIHKDNAASLSLFLKNGFFRQREDKMSFLT